MGKYSFETIKQSLFLKQIAALLAINIYFAFIPFNAFSQQAFSYTQYMINPIPFNSAFSSVDNDTRADLMLRKQWAGIVGAPTTQFADGFMPIEKTNGAAGLIFENDKLGFESLTQLNGFYSQSVKIGKQGFLGLSLNLGLRNYSLNYSSAQSSDPSAPQDFRETKPNIGFGLVYFSENFYIGLSAPQFTFNTSSSTLTVKNNNFRNDYFLTAGVTNNLLNGLKWKFATLMTYTSGVGPTADISSMFMYREIFGVGLNYASNNEAALILNAKFRSFSFGYSYQFGLNTANNIGGPTNATQELTLSYSLGHRRFYVKKSSKVF